MAKTIMLTRDEGEHLVDLLEHEFRAGRQCGRMADVASEIRKSFGMIDQMDMLYGEDRSLGHPSLPRYTSQAVV